MGKRRTLQGKVRIVPEFLNASTSAAELCRKHDVSSTTFQNLKN